MEAIQLLLKTDLFVVVMGLDTRYVTRALEKEYKEILEHDGDPSGLDYIEKIIQIPYRIRPIESDGLGNFIRSQADIEEIIIDRDQISAPVDGITGGGTTPETNEPVPDDPGSDENVDPDDEKPPPGIKSEGDDKIGSKGTPIKKTTPVKKEPIDELPPEIVSLGKEDCDDLYACCQQINLTPRSVKRLINVLKLIKIFWYRKQGYEKSREIKQTVIGLLALSACYPEIMSKVFDELDVKFKDKSKISITFFKYLETCDPLINDRNPVHRQLLDRLRNDVKALEQVTIKNGGSPLRFFDITLEKFTSATFNLVRSFSFVGDPSYEMERSSENVNNVVNPYNLQ